MKFTYPKSQTGIGVYIALTPAILKFQSLCYVDSRKCWAFEVPGEILNANQAMIIFFLTICSILLLIGSIVDEVEAWLANADNVDLARLKFIEANVVSKFPDFACFENLGNGSFLKFLTSHKELLEAIEQVGGLTMARSGRQGTRLGHQVSLIGVLDFMSQCGLQTSPVSQ